MTSRLRLLLLYGGRSAEHEISRVSAAAVARSLDPRRYEVVPVAITQDGRWLLPPHVDPDGAGGLEVAGEPVVLVPDPGQPRLLCLSEGPGMASEIDVDVAFPVLHGPFGEDGTIQGLLELAGLPYVGSGVVGSAVAMDKVMTKRACAARGLPTARHLAWRDVDVAPDSVEAELGYPCFVKPSSLGSSVGVSKVASPDDLETALAQAFAYDEWVLVEEAIVGREIEVGVLGDLRPEASAPGEIVAADDFYSFDDKYVDGAAKLLAPAPLPPARADEARRLALEAFDACRCEGMARVDLFYEEGGRGFLVNEVNTIPGFTPISMYPRLFELAGLTSAGLADRLVDLALARRDRRKLRVGRTRPL